jgi:hypothetical protein
MSIQNILSYFFEQQNKETPNTISNLLNQITGDGNKSKGKIVELKAIETPEVDNSIMMKQYLEDLKKSPAPKEAEKKEIKPPTINKFYSSETPI